MEELSIDTFLSEKELVVLSGLKNLRRLEIGEIKSRKQAQELEFANLKELTITNPEDLVWFQDSPAIEKLKIWQKCSGKDFEEISRLKALTCIDLRINAIGDLSLLVGLKNLIQLNVVIESPDGR